VQREIYFAGTVGQGGISCRAGEGKDGGCSGPVFVVAEPQNPVYNGLTFRGGPHETLPPGF